MWRTRLRGSGVGTQYSGEAQPVVYDGTAYVSTGADDVFAISIDSGEILWQYSANLDPNITSVCCGWTNRGVAVSADRVFVGRLDARLVALDRSTGKPVWDVQAERWQENFSITAAPLYYDGMVIVGFAGADRGTRGRVKAYDAKDGKLLWTFYTIPGPGEPGHETWPQDNDAWKYGGASVWQTPAVDPELGLVYFSTGNPGPDFNGTVRRGDNLYFGVDRRDRGENRQVPLALPAGASRPLGLRLEQPRRAHGSRCRRPRAQGASSKSARPASRTSSTARRASRSSASTRSPCRRSRCKRPPRLSRSRAAKPSCRRRSRSRRKASTS